MTAAHIGVTANAGIVTLTGHVDNLVEKLAAEAAARRVKGVKAVVEEIEVRLPFDVTRNDEDIAAAVINRLAWDVSVPSDAIKVKVEGGWVTLKGGTVRLGGSVETPHERQVAAATAWSAPGVIDVINDIEIAD